MPVKHPIQRPYCITTCQKIPIFNDYGKCFYGKFHYGDGVLISGIYRRRPTKRGVTIVRMDFYPYDTTRTGPRAAMRDLFLYAVAEWQAQTEAQRQYWRDDASVRGRRGYNRFLTAFFKQAFVGGYGTMLYGSQHYGAPCPFVQPVL